MLGSLLILLVMPIADTSRIRGNQFRPFNKLFFWVLVVDFIILFWIGAQHPEEPFVMIGQVASVLYFAWFLFFTPLIGIIENTLFDIALHNQNNETRK